MLNASPTSSPSPNSSHSRYWPSLLSSRFYILVISYKDCEETNSLEFFQELCKSLIRMQEVILEAKKWSNNCRVYWESWRQRKKQEYSMCSFFQWRHRHEYLLRCAIESNIITTADLSANLIREEFKLTTVCFLFLWFILFSKRQRIHIIIISTFSRLV